MSRYKNRVVGLIFSKVVAKRSTDIEIYASRKD